MSDSGRLTGSCASTEPVSRLGPTGFDPERIGDGDILELAEKARRAVCAQPAGYLVDPGAGSGMDRFQRTEPCMMQCADMARRGGSYEALYTGTTIEKMLLHVVRAAIAMETRRAETSSGSVEDDSAAIAHKGDA